jgi:large subunit ribosomal protein L30
MADLTIKQIKSASGSSKKQLGTLRSLGLGRIGRQVERPDNEVVRGQVHAIRHLLEVKDA